jgi:hypothetical protein
MNFYESATHGWKPEEGPTLADKYPVAVFASMAAPIAAAFLFLLRFV